VGCAEVAARRIINFDGRARVVLMGDRDP
jgi:hypothetical protein